MRPAHLRCLALALLSSLALGDTPAFAGPPTGAADLGADSALGERPPLGLSPAPSRDVVLLDRSALLERALRAALSPWEMRVESVVREAPPPTLPGAALHAAELARELDAKALVWMTSHADGGALWIYEASEGTISARPIPDAPLDRALAAALALSVKTWLRSSDQTPKTEPVVEAAVVPAPAVHARPPPAVIPGRERPPQRSDAARWQLVIHAGARRGAFEQTLFEPRYGVEVRMSPPASASSTRTFLAARIELGAARDVGNAAFRGVYSELGAGVSIGVARRLAEPVNVALHVGAAFHRGTVEGTLLLDRSAAERAEWGAAAQLRPEAELAFGSIGILVQPTVGVSILGERYRADEQVLLETRRVWWMLGGALRAEIF